VLEIIDCTLPIASAFVGEHLGGDERDTAAVAPLMEQLLASIGRRQARRPPYSHSHRRRSLRPTPRQSASGSSLTHRSSVPAQRQPQQDAARPPEEGAPGHCPLRKLLH
jgi:hypothetical protein